jgi:hypothetical protein
MRRGKCEKASNVIPLANQSAAKGVYEQTEAERAALKSMSRRRAEHTPLPAVKVTQNGEAVTMSPDHEDLGTGTALHWSALAVAYPAYYEHTLSAFANISMRKRVVSASKIEQLLALAAGVRPTDQVESMLAVQMAAIHDATLEMASRMKHVDSIQQHDSAERTLNKLARTFAAQIEALKRYRSKGEQRVYVERVDVREGGQAIVGNVAHGGGGGQKSGS